MVRHILLTCLLTMMSSWALFAQSGYRIEVTPEGVSSSEAYLAYYFGDKQYIKDTTAIKDGVLVFEGEEALDGGIYLVVFPPENNYFEILVDQDQYFQVRTNASDFVGTMKVQGSEDNQLFYGDLQYLSTKRAELQTIQTAMKAAPAGSEEQARLKGELETLDKEVKGHRNQLIEEYPDNLFTKIILGTRDPEIPPAPKDENGNIIDSTFQLRYYKAHFFDNFDWADGRLLRTPVLFNRVNAYMTRLTNKFQPDSINKSLEYILDNAKANHESFQFLLAHYLNEYVESPYMGMDAVYCNLVDKYYRDEQLVDWIDSTARDKMITQCARITYTLIGNQAPDFQVKDLGGKPVTLSGTPGEYVVVYFWDYNCGHCKKITPRLQKMVEKYNLADYGVKVITININGEVEDWKERIEEYNLDMEGAIINTEDIERKSYATAYYNITSTPRMFLLDKNKKILAKQITPEQMIDILGQNLGFEVDEEDKQVIPEEEDLEEEEEGSEAEGVEDSKEK